LQELSDLSDVTFVTIDDTHFTAHKPVHNMTSTEKCFYYDKGFCKLKGQCSKKHPSSDCQGQCDDKKICPFRHRMLCKNGTKCIFLSSQSCEFLHTGNILENNDNIENFQNYVVEIKGFVKGIEEKLNTLGTVIKETQTRLSAMQKDVYKNNQIENKVNQLEKDNLDLKIKLNTTETLLRKKFEELLNKIKVLEPKEHILLNNYAVSPNKIIKKQNVIPPLNNFRCEICRREFKNENNLENHDKRYHIIKGTNLYKCENCDEKLENKNKLKHHINKEHITCSLCEKVYPTITSLNNHITAVHDKLKPKHNIEREPSLRIHKVKRFMTKNNEI
jgi:hypothetical protein